MTDDAKDEKLGKIENSEENLFAIFYFQQFYLIILDTYRILATFFHL